MTDAQLFARISSLPDELQREVWDYVAFLKQQSGNKKKIKERHFGYSKGFFKVGDDFDQPLDEFREHSG